MSGSSSLAAGRAGRLSFTSQPILIKNSNLMTTIICNENEISFVGKNFKPPAEGPSVLPFKKCNTGRLSKPEKKSVVLSSFFSQPIHLKQINIREKQKMRTGHGEQVLFFCSVFLEKDRV